MRMGYVEEARMFMRWIGDRCRDTTDSEHPLQIMYGISGEKELPEVELNHLDGYRGSKPVRVGNGAHKQLGKCQFGPRQRRVARSRVRLQQACLPYLVRSLAFTEPDPGLGC